MRACNKQLLGKLYADQLYLERLLVNPHFLNGRQSMLVLEKQLNKKEGKHKEAEDPKDHEDPIQRKVTTSCLLIYIFCTLIIVIKRTRLIGIYI